MLVRQSRQSLSIIYLSNDRSIERSIYLSSIYLSLITLVVCIKRMVGDNSGNRRAALNVLEKSGENVMEACTTVVAVERKRLKR